MSDSPAAAVLSYVRELEARDRAAVEAIELLGALEAEVEAIRGRAGELRDLLASLPERRTEIAARRAAAQEDLERRRRAVEEALRELEEAEKHRSEERIADAQRAVARAQEHAAAGAARVARIEQQAADLEEQAAAAERELPELRARAAKIAARMRDAPRVADPPAPGDDLVDWGSRARAALYLARTGFEREREQIVREAGEIGTSALGEPVYGSTVEALVRRLEQRTQSAT